MIKNTTVLLVLLRLFLGYIFFSAGVCKLSNGQFGQLIGPPWLEEALARHGLGLFAQVVAISQVTCGALLLSQRLGLLGAIMLVPMNVAILAVTVSMNWAGTPYVNAVLLLLNLLLLLMDRQKFTFLLRPTATHVICPTLTDQFGQNRYSWLGLAFTVITLVVAKHSILVTNLFASAAFLAFGLTILSSRLFGNLDKLLLSLPFAAMGIVTFVGQNSTTFPLLLLVLATEVTLLAVRLYLGSRNGNTSEAGTLAGSTEV